jgi:hypothetical protein
LWQQGVKVGGDDREVIEAEQCEMKGMDGRCGIELKLLTEKWVLWHENDREPTDKFRSWGP